MTIWPARVRRLWLAISVACAACSSPTPAPLLPASSDGGGDEDGGTDAGCSALRGSDFEPVETRCDGIDNDCDGVMDARWVAIHQRSSELTWDVPAVGIDGGFLVVRHQGVQDGGMQLERLNARLEHSATVGALPLPAAHFGSGQVSSVELLQTSQGITAAYVRAGNLGDRSLFQVLLAQDGTPIAGSDGEAKRIPLPGDGGMVRSARFATSTDGARLLSAWSASAGPSSEPDLIQAVVTNERGERVAGPSTVMTSAADWLVLQEVSVASDGTFVIAAEEGSSAGNKLRVQKFGWDLQPAGTEGELPLQYSSPVSGDAHVRMVADQDSTVLAYRDQAADGGAGIYLVEEVFDAGSPREWISTGGEVPWFELARTSQGVHVTYKAQRVCADCPSHGIGTSYAGRVFIASTAGVTRDLTASAEDLVFPGEARPGTQLVPGRFGGDFVFFVPVENDAGTELKALWYCAP